MITPSCDEILELAKEYTTIPVCREIYADMTTPIALLRRLQIRSDRFFLLESVEGGEKWARYSFLGYDPILRATCGTVTQPQKRHGNARGYGRRHHAMLGYGQDGMIDRFVRQRSSRMTTSSRIVLVVNMKTDSVMEENYGKACAALEGMAALISDRTPSAAPTRQQADKSPLSTPTSWRKPANTSLTISFSGGARRRVPRAPHPYAPLH